MTDVHSKETRRFNMSRIRSKDTKPELIVRRFMFSHGFRFKLHDKSLPGKPDLVLPQYKTVVFIHGCFWHGHEGCRYYVVPKTRTEWWQNKIGTNISKNLASGSRLRDAGWKVLTVWECELKKISLDSTLNHLLMELSA